MSTVGRGLPCSIFLSFSRSKAVHNLSTRRFVSLAWNSIGYGDGGGRTRQPTSRQSSCMQPGLAASTMPPNRPTRLLRRWIQDAETICLCGGGFVPTNPPPMPALHRTRCHPGTLAISFRAPGSGPRERLADLRHRLARLSQPNVKQRKQSLEEIAQWQL